MVVTTLELLRYTCLFVFRFLTGLLRILSRLLSGKIVPGGYTGMDRYRTEFFYFCDSCLDKKSNKFTKKNQKNPNKS